MARLVLAVACSRRLFLGGQDGRAYGHIADLPAAAWVARSCGAGSKGERLYERALVPFSQPTGRGLRRGLLVRRSLFDPADRAYYLTHVPAEACEDDLALVAGSRSTVENRPHHDRDVTMGEDNSVTRTGSGPQMLAAPRNTTIGRLRRAGSTSIAASSRLDAARVIDLIKLFRELTD